MGGKHQKPGERRECSREAVDAETVERLALALAKPGSDAMLIDEGNLSAGRMPIPEAARSGRPFAVELRDDVVGLDVDEREAVHWVTNSLIGNLESRNISTVVANSGVPGHLHVFAPVRDSHLKQEIEVAARFAGCDVRAGQRIRPPLSPHRQGFPVSLVTPANAAQALAALASTGEPRRAAIGERRLSERILALLRDGDLEARYDSRSEVIQAIALAAVNANRSETWLAKVLLNANNRGGEKVQELARTKGERAARRYIARVFRNGYEFFAGRPPFRSRADADGSIDVFEQGVDADAARWKGRAGATDRAVEQAHITIMRRCGAIEHGAGVREVATLAGISSLSTVSEAHRRLERDGYLRRVDQATRGRAARYVAELPRSPSRTVCSSRALGDCSFKELGADAFRWRDGLGKATGRAWCALDGRTAAELAVALELKERSVRKHLRRLAMYQLAERGADGRWRQLNHLDAAAALLGVAGERDRQRAQYEEEREAYRQRRLRHTGRVALRKDSK
jgi:hypothetical protein